MFEEWKEQTAHLQDQERSREEAVRTRVDPDVGKAITDEAIQTAQIGADAQRDAVVRLNQEGEGNVAERLPSIEASLDLRREQNRELLEELSKGGEATDADRRADQIDEENIDFFKSGILHGNVFKDGVVFVAKNSF